MPKPRSERPALPFIVSERVWTPHPTDPSNLYTATVISAPPRGTTALVELDETNERFNVPTNELELLDPSDDPQEQSDDD